MARPSHKPTAATRRRVSIAAGGGMSHEAIAQVLRISKPTLEKHYETELASGAYLRRVEVLEKLFAQAKKGSTSAARAFLAHQPEFLPFGTGKQEGQPPAPPAKPGQAAGKKEQADAAAVGAESGSKWEGVLPGNVVALRG